MHRYKLIIVDDQEIGIRKIVYANNHQESLVIGMISVMEGLIGNYGFHLDDNIVRLAHKFVSNQLPREETFTVLQCQVRWIMDERGLIVQVGKSRNRITSEFWIQPIGRRIELECKSVDELVDLVLTLEEERSRVAGGGFAQWR